MDSLSSNDVWLVARLVNIRGLDDATVVKISQSRESATSSTRQRIRHPEITAGRPSKVVRFESFESIRLPKCERYL